MLQTVGIDSERLQFYHLSAAMGTYWAEICTEFTEKIIQLGPSPIHLALREMALQRKNENNPHEA